MADGRCLRLLPVRRQPALLEAGPRLQRRGVRRGIQQSAVLRDPDRPAGSPPRLAGDRSARRMHVLFALLVPARRAEPGTLFEGRDDPRSPARLSRLQLRPRFLLHLGPRDATRPRDGAGSGSLPVAAPVEAARRRARAGAAGAPRARSGRRPGGAVLVVAMPGLPMAALRGVGSRERELARVPDLPTTRISSPTPSI